MRNGKTLYYPKEFLQNLFSQQHQNTYARLTALDINNIPKDVLTGYITNGSVSIDGKSSTRRSINLTLANIEQTEIVQQEGDWALKTKCKIEVGVQNLVDDQYENIIWFNQGTFVLTSFSSSISVNQGRVINLQGRDKMCYLDGTLGGTFLSDVKFDSYEQYHAWGPKIIKYPIKQIIWDLIHQFGNESPHNIIIKDLDNVNAMQVVEYVGPQPLYIWRKAEESSYHYTNCSFHGDQICYIEGDLSLKLDGLQYENFNSLQQDLIQPTRFALNSQDKTYPYICSKIEYGNTAGYMLSELIYPGELDAKTGESITSVLDKIIKNVLINYEYFYDVDGHFIFQKKPSYEMEEYSGIRTQEDGSSYGVSWVEAQEEIAYQFTDLNLITALAKNPKIDNIKNDFTVWGNRSGVDGDDIPIHMRYSINNYPTKYTTIEVTEEELSEYNKKYNLNVQPQTSTTFIARDDFQTYLTKAPDSTIYFSQKYYVNWREILWQMQQDYRKYGHLDNFEQKIIQANEDEYPTGKTGYEQYYIDIEGFLHNEIYNLDIWTEILQAYGLHRELRDTKEVIRGITRAEIELELSRLSALQGNNQDYDEWVETWTQIKWDLDNIRTSQPPEKAYKLFTSYYLDEPTSTDSAEVSALKRQRLFWNKNVFQEPSKLNFWIDFMSGDGELMQQIGIPAIQAKAKVETNKGVKAIDYANIPNIIYCQNGIPTSQRSGYSYFNMGDKLNQYFITSTIGISAKEAIENMVYTYAQLDEQISITCTPIYYLEPNTRIHINSKEYNINSDYIIQSMTIPLAYNGTMSINATKARKRIF